MDRTENMLWFIDSNKVLFERCQWTSNANIYFVKVKLAGFCFLLVPESEHSTLFLIKNVYALNFYFVYEI